MVVLDEYERLLNGHWAPVDDGLDLLGFLTARAVRDTFGWADIASMYDFRLPFDERVRCTWAPHNEELLAWRARTHPQQRRQRWLRSRSAGGRRGDDEGTPGLLGLA